MTKFKSFCFLLMMLIPFGAFAEKHVKEVEFSDYKPDYVWYNKDYPNPFYGIYYYDVKVEIENYSVTNDTASITNGKILNVEGGSVKHKYPVKGITQKNYNGLITVTTNSPRKGSKEVVDWVRKQFRASGIDWSYANMAAYTNGAQEPKKLDFAVKVDLIITSSRNPSIRYVCRNVILAKGHTAFYNNWWIFSNVDNSKDNDVPYTLKCDGGDIRYIATSNNGFRFLMPDN